MILLIEGALSKLAKKLVRIKPINPITFKVKPIKQDGWYDGGKGSLRRRQILFDGESIGELIYRYQGFDKKIGRYRYYVSWFKLNSKMKNKQLGTHALSTFLGSVRRPTRVSLMAQSQDWDLEDAQRKLLRFYKRLGFRFYKDAVSDDFGIIDID